MVFDARKEKLCRDRRRLRQVIDFAYFGGCRHKFILDYFGDQSSARLCGGCDNCEKGRIPSALVEGAVTRQGDFSFAVQRRADARQAG